MITPLAISCHLARAGRIGDECACGSRTHNGKSTGGAAEAAGIRIITAGIKHDDVEAIISIGHLIKDLIGVNRPVFLHPTPC